MLNMFLIRIYNLLIKKDEVLDGHLSLPSHLYHFITKIFAACIKIRIRNNTNSVQIRFS